MTLARSVRKFVLSIHLASSIGWIGAVLTYLALVIAAMAGADAGVVPPTWRALELIGRAVLVPLSISALATGLIMSLGTQWGLFRHYWVLVSLVLTSIATAVLIQHMETVRYFASLSAVTGYEAAAQAGLQGELLHAGIGLVVLLVVLVLNVYKPRGMTPYGWRVQQRD